MVMIDMKKIKRLNYLEQLILLQNTPDIKIITGVRRSGKSMLLEEYIEYIKENDSNANIIYINFHKIEYDEIKDYKKLNSYIKKCFAVCKNNYLFIDEVQLCNQFEIAINDLYESKEYDIYLTGSNAFLLSSDLATLFTGRYFEIKVYPFSFSEYVEYYNLSSNIFNAFDNYVIEGGFAGSYLYKLDSQKIAYINNVIDVVILKDIMKKNNVSNEQAMQNLTEFLMDNIGNLTSQRNISDILNKNGISIDHKTVSVYIRYLCLGFIFYKVKRYDIKGKGYLETNEKYYLVDSSARFAKQGKRNLDYGRVYENIIAMELLRRGYEIYVGKLYQKEVDFVAMKGTEKIYIQVADNISSPNTLERELAPLKQIKDSYPKVLIANTKHDEYDIEGIKVVDIANWLYQAVNKS